MQTSESPPVDVLVIGAGPTGLALASWLGAMGVGVRLVDRHADRVQESRAFAIQPRTLELLRELGLSNPLIQDGNHGAELRVHTTRSVVPVRLFDTGMDDTAFPFLLFLPQFDVERIITDHLDGQRVRVERETEVIALDAGADAVRAMLRHADRREEPLSARYVVGCDGAHSFVRSASGIPFDGGAYPQTFVLADLEVDGLERGCVHAFVGADGFLFFFPLQRPTSWRLQAIWTGGDDVTLEELQALVDARSSGLHLRDPVWTTLFRIHHRLARRYRAGRMFLAGDAAHVHSPAGALGMNTGIQDACNLGWKLGLVLRGVADADLLDTYESERRPVGRSAVRSSDRPFAIATSQAWWIRQARARVPALLLPLLASWRTVRRVLFRATSQLDISYRRHAFPVRGPTVGDRLPDAQIASGEREQWLHELLSPSAFTLLLCAARDAWDYAALARIVDRYATLVVVRRVGPGDTFERLRVRGAAQFLIRPDGYVAARFEGLDLSRIEGAIATWLPHAQR